MMRNQQRNPKRESQRRDIMKPTLRPRNLHFWLKDYEKEANAKFGDASVYVFTDAEPLYSEDNFVTYLRRKLNLRNNAALNGIDEDLRKLNQKQWFHKRSEYADQLVSMYNDMILHFSDESTNLIQSFEREYTRCSTNKDPKALLQLVKTSHTQDGRVASREEKEQKKDRLKAHRQWDSNNKVHGIHSHNQLFKDLLDDTREVGVEWTNADIVDMYLKSVDNSLIEADLARINVPGSTEMPTNLEDAQFWVIDANRRNKLIRDNRPGNAKRKAEPERVHVTDAAAPKAKSSDSYPECSFCKKNHLGGAQECAFLKQHIKDHPEEVTATLAKKVSYPSSKKPRTTGRGKGKGGRGHGRGHGSARGRRGKAGRGSGEKGSSSNSDSNTAMHATDAPNDTWGDFQREQVLNSLYHYEVTVFKSGKAKLNQKQQLLTYLYDNGATLNLFCNEDLLWNVEDVQPVRINGIGDVWVTRRGQSLFGPAYVLNTLPFNIIAEQEVMNNDHVKFDSRKSPHYFVNGIKWSRQVNGLITCTHEEACKMIANRLAADTHFTEEQHSTYVTQYVLALDALPDGTYYNAQQRRRAAAVQRIHQILNHPGDDVLSVLFDRGGIHGCPYTSRDVRVMRKIFGPCVACTKGKTVRATPGKVINQWVASAPGERLCMDIFFLSVVSRKGIVVSLPFLLVVDDYTEYVTIVWLSSRTTATVMRALKEIIKFYYAYDWQVKEICGDRDSIFVPLKTPLLEEKVELDIRGTDQKIPRADRMIRTIRDIFRTIKASLWYRLPQFLYPHFIEDTADVWNIRPNSRTIDRSPREIVQGKKLEYDQHIKTAVGTVGEFFVPPTKQQGTSKEDREVKKNEERTATGIVIKRNFDATGTLEIYNIDEGTRVNRCRVKLIRQPSTALKSKLHALAPAKVVVDEDMFLPVPKMTSSSKRSRQTNPTDAPLEAPAPPQVTTDDSEDRRGDNIIDASSPMVELQQDNTLLDNPSEPQSTDVENDDMPSVRSTDDSEDTAPIEVTEKAEQSTQSSDSNPDDTQTHCDTSTVTGVTEVTDHITPNTGSNSHNSTPDMNLSPNHVDVQQQDYPRRPGDRGLIRKANPQQQEHQKETAAPGRVRAQRSNAGKQPQRFAHLADITTDLDHTFQNYVYTAADNMTIAQAAAKYPDLHCKALNAELKQFHDMGVGRPIKQMPSGLKHHKILGCKGFFKDIFDLRTGVLKKLKFRIVPHGHLLDRNLYDPKEMTSPTVAMESIFSCINIAAKENRHGFTMDIPGAYLNAQLKDKHVVRFPRDLATAYIQLYPEYLSNLQSDGTLLMLIEKALYGLVESSALWYEEIKKFLENLDYKVHPSDLGVFQKKADNDTITICLWVDDFLGFSTCETLILELEKKVRERFGDARFDNGQILNYIGMTISQAKNGNINVKQEEYIKKIVAESGVTKSSASPNHADIMKRKTAKTVKPLKDQKRYLSLVMSAMYAAKRTRPEILPPVCILASRVNNPDTDDMKYLLRVYEYLNGNPHLGLRFNPDKIKLNYWIDASYNLHSDSRGHTGIVVTVGKQNAPIYVRSQKQKLNTRSSTEAELVATDEGVLHLLWLILIFDFLGYPQTPVRVFQDNMSTMRVCQTGHSKSGRLKHMVVRYHFIHCQQESKVITFEYVKSADMLADIMSKPVDPPTFARLKKRLLNEA